ncbi:hypothetical protein GCM10010123_04030 [Pilimelia anulata]|uniref:Flavoprotein domain-containing protein n=1 Tax=Pilimelia anulata TaxID=53371 RepID=A0A8J3AYZ8_9ACTN|nr:flavoprotein [Pilimelia anulata]GGJ77218.1 hypothetical protein GCM10010123_04030 [Pilimelia anulata]
MLPFRVGAGVAGRVLDIVVCAAPPARRIHEFVDAVRVAGWAPRIVATPTAATWLPLAELAARTGHPVRHRPRRPDEPRALPPAAAVAVAPATFTVLNKWATGINDSVALGVLNEALGAGLPIVAAPHAKPILAAHPAFVGHLRLLASAGVRLTPTGDLEPATPGDPCRWGAVLELLPEPGRCLPSRSGPATDTDESNRDPLAAQPGAARRRTPAAPTAARPRTATPTPSTPAAPTTSR